ncbi:hypothetical protein QYE76_070933 [Lolium multiflorum]|uniref:DUF3615 domain-containing protein n=1 Tax=Lolium multiflorum TaxID=4521 RepID=A0AAD8SKQ2_LOLMU|nr:hypothetical protein QYE76_070933 [Lolium multiflorum]
MVHSYSCTRAYLVISSSTSSGMDFSRGRSINNDAFAGLETWEDPTPRPSPFTFDDLRDAFVEASKRQMRLRPKSPSKEDLMIRGRSMTPSELELVEIMQINLIDEYGKGYVHFNFSVKSLDGTVHLFFAEVHPDCREVEDVYHCTALNTIDSGHCIGCKDRASDLHHPNDGG